MTDYTFIKRRKKILTGCPFGCPFFLFAFCFLEKTTFLLQVIPVNIYPQNQFRQKLEKKVQVQQGELSKRAQEFGDPLLALFLLTHFSSLLDFSVQELTSFLAFFSPITAVHISNFYNGLVCYLLSLHYIYPHPLKSSHTHILLSAFG
jgi:hypothetical protein